MKKVFAIILMLAVCLTLLAGCAGDTPAVEDDAKETELQQTTAQQETTEPAPIYEEGTLWLRTHQKMSNNDGSGTYFTEFKYDEYGRLIEEIKTKANGSANGRCEYFYNEYDFLIEKVSYDKNGAKTYTYAYEYDEDGNLCKETATKDGEVRWVTTWVYNGARYILEEKTEDSRGVKIFEYEYNEDYSERTEYCVDGDSRWISSVTELGLNNVELKSTAYNSNGKKTSVKTFSYGKHGLESIDVDHRNSDTLSDYVIYYTYDENGNLIKEVADYYYGATYEYTYEPVTVKRRVN